MVSKSSGWSATRIAKLLGGVVFGACTTVLLLAIASIRHREFIVYEQSWTRRPPHYSYENDCVGVTWNPDRLLYERAPFNRRCIGIPHGKTRCALLHEDGTSTPVACP